MLRSRCDPEPLICGTRHLSTVAGGNTSTLVYYLEVPIAGASQ